MADDLPEAKLVPELICADFDRSLRFYTDVLGFVVRFSRPEERFAYLDREGAEIMLIAGEEEQPGVRFFVIGELEHPYGRGMNLQIKVDDIASLLAAVQASEATIFLPLEDKWYRVDDKLAGNRQFIVQDPDGYLLRFFEGLGWKPA
jgi:catechol 2,3-dioxygenase-like lactoylglutathione lyase family enzyme